MTDKSPATGAHAPADEIIAGRYKVDKLIARGGMATVYLAHHVKLNRPVALKILTPPNEGDDDANFETRFRLEAETLASLDHPNIVILHDFGDIDDGRFFLAMEFVDGPRLSDILKPGPLESERAMRLIVQVCKALRYAHGQGIVHRDLKPSNLLIKQNADGTETVKVVDFGLVKLTEDDQLITKAGIILGSPHCMAPEQVKGLSLDHRADIYAIGILLFRSLTGQYPFHGPNSAATMIAHLNDPVPTFFSIAPDVRVPPGVEEIVRRCLAKRMDDRYPDMQAVVQALMSVMDAPGDLLTVSRSQASLFTSPPAPPRANTGRTIGLTLAATFAVLTLVVLTLVVGLVLGGLMRSTPPSGGTQPGGQIVPATPLSGQVVPATPLSGQVVPATADDAPSMGSARPPSGSFDGANQAIAPTSDAPDGTPGSADNPPSVNPSTVDPASVAPAASDNPAPGGPAISAPKPAPVAPKPAPVTPKTAPVAPKTAPKPTAPTPKPEAPTEDDAPSGYMGLPTDF